ncbi:hypothetical protein PITCH_A1280014 [uncultured Desulfobacterium sp.]|uniref:Uncharacterized protein n=1 Tax=uncultured Desulfobacterium sp. TaxID=201089 RepID=A0A445MS42_9BACT|nr:hypothetical protein PITCH_A1280014 [uncultured Desulfobacterium sp.]
MINMHILHIPLGLVYALADRLRDLIGLPQSTADGSLSVTNNNDGAESEFSSTLYNLRHPIYVDNLLYKLDFFLFFEQYQSPLNLKHIAFYPSKPLH